jgi:hypothetical protein
MINDRDIRRPAQGRGLAGSEARLSGRLSARGNDPTSADERMRQSWRYRSV